MAKKTLRKGDNHKKKTRSKRGKRGGKPPTLQEIYEGYVVNIYRPGHEYLTGRESTGAINKNIANQDKNIANQDETPRKTERMTAREMERNSRIQEMETVPGKYYVEKPNDIDNNPSIEGGELIKLLMNHPNNDIVQYGNFYIYLRHFGKINEKEINLKLILGKAIGSKYGVTVQFRNEMGRDNYIDIRRVKSFYYTLDKPDEKSNEEPDEKSNEQQPGGNRKKKTRSKRTKRGTKRATK